MKGKKWFGVLLASFTIFGLSLSVSLNASAASAQVNQADVLFYNSYHGQFDATVNLPWSANVGGNVNDTVDFFINRVSMLFPIQAQASATNIYGRLVMRFTPAFTSTETAYFCDKKLNDYTSSVDSISISCPGSVTYYYSDGTSFTSTLPLFFNYSLPSGALNVYADYSQVLPSVSLTGVRFTIAKTGNYDVYSVLNGYQLVLTTLVSDASYFITDPTTGGGTDITPLVNQNQVIINQNQTIIDQDNQDRQEISDTSENGEETGEDAGDAAANKGQTLLQAFGSLIAALGQVHETNCILPNMSVYSLQLNNMDMCAVSLPQGVSALIGVGICVLIVVLGIKLVKRMIALYKEITG